ncbi:MAG TPA: hypothetical protein VGM63_15150 [Mucilaginibacter sp.]
MNFNELLKPAETTDQPATDITNTDQPAADTNSDSVDNNAATDQSTEPAAQQQQSQDQNTQQQTDGAAPAANAETKQIDFNAIIDEMSGGVIKDADSFKAFLPKLTEYETLKQKHDELSAEMAKAPVFADDEVRILNELKTAGATKEQLRTFQKINEYGNISEMPDREARIAKMIMIDGVKPSVAELKVDREFRLNDDSVSEEEREILDDDMRVAAKNDKAELEKFKAQVSQMETVPPEQAQLQQQTKLLAHQATVKPYVADVIKSIPNMGVFTLAGEGDSAVSMELEMDDNARTKLAGYVENYFMDGLTPVTPENTREALHYARAEYVRENLPEILKAAYDRAESIVTERLTNKYENRSGLKPQQDNPVLGGPNADAETATWMANRVNKTAAVTN